MGKRSRRHRVRLEKDQAGCMWGLISIFDFRHGRSTRKLLLDRRRGNRHTVGAEYPKTELKMLTYYDEKNLITEDLEESGLAKADGLRSSVKELMEEEMVSEQGLKKSMNSADEQLNQLNSKNGGHVREKPKQTKKHRSKSCDMHIIDLDGAENSSNLETSKNLDLEVILEELCRSNQKGSCLKHDWRDDVDIKSDQVYSLVEEKLGAAIKVFIGQRFSNDKNLAEDGKTHYSKELIDALQTLSSNKELFLELLHDPNSLLVKHIQCMEDARLNKDENTSSLLGSNLLEEEKSKPRPVELTNRKQFSFFRRRSKSQDSHSLKDNENFQPSSRIVILKPGPATSRNSGTESSVSTSVQSRQTMDNKPHSERNASQFSLNEIKRKLKHAMGKERHGISRNGKFPSEFQNKKSHEKGVGEGNGGWSSPNRNHFYTERYAKSLLGIKRGDKIGKSKESETTMVNETIDNPKQGVSNIYIEAKKHLSELLSGGDEKEELMSRQLPKTLGRILSLPEYSCTSSGSPPKDREHSFVTAQMRLSPRSNFNMVNENKWQIIQDNHVIPLSPPKQNSESQSSISDDKPDEKGPPKRPIHAASTWVRRQPPKVKAFLAVVAGMAALVLLRAIVHDHDNLFVAAEAVHSIGISVLIYKLMKEKTCAGLSLKTQELTAMFLAVRLYCSFVMEYDIHTLLDLATLGTTLWVIYMIRFKLRSSYMEDKDNFAIYYVVVPCAVFALLIHPSTSHHFINRIFWAFCVYLESVSVLPQLRVMQNTKIVEPFTSHYVFALGVSRFLSCAHWVLQVLDTSGHLLTALGHGLWPSMVLISEVVQTFILADFCYYYIKSVFGGQLVLRLPSGVV